MENLFNMDETPIMFEMVGKTTIAKIGERNINIRTFGSERSRISVILCISASGSKLPPLLIFKGKKGGYIEDELKKNPNVKAQKIHVLCQENSWADSDIFNYWITNIFFNNRYVKNSFEKILILDRATTHYDPKLIDIFKQHKSYFLLIPPGLTRFIQPLDVGINGPFKKAMHHWDLDFRIKNLNNKKPTRDDIINAVVNIWYNDDLISRKNIISSFKCTGISVKLDGTEQNLIKKYDEVCDEIILPSDVILNDDFITEAENIYNDLEEKKIKVKDGNNKITNYFKIENDVMDIE